MGFSMVGSTLETRNVKNSYYLGIKLGKLWFDNYVLLGNFEILR